MSFNPKRRKQGKEKEGAGGCVALSLTQNMPKKKFKVSERRVQGLTTFSSEKDYKI